MTVAERWKRRSYIWEKRIQCLNMKCEGEGVVAESTLLEDWGMGDGRAVNRGNEYKREE